MEENNLNPGTNTNNFVETGQTTDLESNKPVEEEVPEQQTNEPLPKPTPQKQSRKKIIIGLTLLAVILFSSLFYFFYQKTNVETQTTQAPVTIGSVTDLSPTLVPSPTSTWKTHTTSTYSFKYPPNTQIREEEGSTAVVAFSGPTQTADTELFDGYSVSFQPREIPNVDIVEHAQNTVVTLNNSGICTITKPPSPVTINGYSSATYKATCMGENTYYYLQSKDKILLVEIITSTADPESIGYEEVVDQILSTFEFVK